MATYEHLLSEYRTLAKRADQRLVSLEKYSEQEHYKGIKQYAYARAMRDIAQWSGEKDKGRFNTKPPENAQQLQAKINDIKNFLSAPTSTKTGVTNIYKKRAETVNKKYGTSYTWKDLATYYESDVSKKLDKKYGSGTITVVIDVLKQSGAEDKDITEVINKNKKVENNEVLFEITKRMLKEYPEIKELF